MNLLNVLFISAILFLAATSCETVNNTVVKINSLKENHNIVNKSFQDILDSANVKGAIVILRDNNYHSNDFVWAQTGHLPASTFKIPNSIVALEESIMYDDSVLIEWDGVPRYQKRWEQNLLFREAFHYSCVPCYQDIARLIGVKKMRDYMNDLKYGSMDFDSTNLDMFWLRGKSKINQHQQIDFLKRFNEQQLPISKRTYSIMQRMMIVEDNKEYVLRGKTGWSVQDNVDNCWFVGYVITDKEVCYFATNIEPNVKTNIESIASIRKEVTFKALKSIGVLDD